MLLQVFNIVAPIFIIAGIGYLYGAWMRPEMGITNRLNMDVFIPALIFHVMIQKDFYPSQYIGLMIGGTIVMLGSGVLAYVLARVMGFNSRSFVPPAIFCNWANLGLPLYVFALGPEALDGGVVLVIVGNVLCFTLGVYLYSGSLSIASVFKTPVMLAVLIGGAVNAFGFAVPEVIDTPIDMMGKVAIPLMLFSLGVRLTKISWTDSVQGLVMAVFSPVIGVAIALCLIYVLPLNQLHQSILILFGVLPPAVVNFMLAEQYGCESERVASMVLLSNLFSMITIPIVLYFLLVN